MRVLDGRGPAPRSPHLHEGSAAPGQHSESTRSSLWGGYSQLSTLVRSLPQRDPGRSLPDTLLGGDCDRQSAPPTPPERRARGRRSQRVNTYTEIHGDGRAPDYLIPLSTVGAQTRPMTAAE